MDIFRQINHKRLMVIVLVTIAGVVLAGCTGLFPQFTYQGVLTDASGNPLEWVGDHHLSDFQCRNRWDRHLY